MCFRDRNNIPVSIGSVVEFNDIKYIIKVIEEYDCATVAIVENITNQEVETLLLHDVKKI